MMECYNSKGDRDWLKVDYVSQQKKKQRSTQITDGNNCKQTEDGWGSGILEIHVERSGKTASDMEMPTTKT